MQTTKTLILWLALALTYFLPASAQTPTTPENCIWEIPSIGYDAPTTEVTDLENRTKTSTSNYDTAPIHRTIIEKIPTEANRALFGQNAEFKAAEEGMAIRNLTEKRWKKSLISCNFYGIRAFVSGNGAMLCP